MVNLGVNLSSKIFLVQKSQQRCKEISLLSIFVPVLAQLHAQVKKNIAVHYSRYVWLKVLYKSKLLQSYSCKVFCNKSLTIMSFLNNILV